MPETLSRTMNTSIMCITSLKLRHSTVLECLGKESGFVGMSRWKFKSLEIIMSCVSSVISV